LEGIDEKTHSRTAINNCSISPKRPDAIQDRSEETIVPEWEENEFSPNPGEGTASLVLRERTIF
jgi:hypothetical protein